MVLITVMDNTMEMESLQSQLPFTDLSIMAKTFIQLFLQDFLGSYEDPELWKKDLEFLHANFENKDKIIQLVDRKIRYLYPKSEHERILRSFEEDYDDVKENRLSNLIEKTISLYPIVSLKSLLFGMTAKTAASLTRGITSGLIRGSSEFNMLKGVWRKAIREIHPYQLGPTNQGTIHCVKDVRLLDTLNSLVTLDMDSGPSHSALGQKVTFNEGIALSMAAALHDLFKANLSSVASLASVAPMAPRIRHGIEGAKFIRTHYNELGIGDANYAEAVAKIVEHHTDEINLSASNPPTGTNFRMSEVCALFRLADVLDITFSRVSDIFEVLNSGKLNYKQQLTIIARKKVQWVNFYDPNTTADEVAVLHSDPGGVSPELQAVIKMENAGLDTYGTSQTITLPDGSTLVTVEGCDAGKILKAIKVPFRLTPVP